MDLTEPTQEFVYPEKPIPAKQSNVIGKSILSVALFVGAFYYFFHYDIKFIFILLGVLFIHEMGHFIAMKVFNYKDLSIFFIPLLGAVATGTKDEVSQRQKTIILFAGPVPGIVIGAVLYILGKRNFDFDMIRIANFFLFINLLNLLPIYPLDGGQLVHNLFFKRGAAITNAFLLLSTSAIAWFAVIKEEYQLLLFPFAMALQLTTRRKLAEMQKQLQAEGFNLNKFYNDLTNEEYWTMRDHLASHSIYHRYVEKGNYTVGPKENLIINYIKSLLIHRPLVEDMSMAAKMITVFFWAGCFAFAVWLGVASPYIDMMVN